MGKLTLRQVLTAGNFDLAMGLLLGLLFSAILEVKDPSLLLFSAFSAVAPDMDILLLAVKGKKIDSHRDLLHLPLVLVPLGAVITYLAKPSWALVWTAGTLLHFIHDTTDDSQGVMWLSPFRKKYYTLGKLSRLEEGSWQKILFDTLFLALSLAVTLLYLY